MQIELAFLKYLETNSAVCLHAVTLKKSAVDSSPALEPKRLFTATVKDTTEIPEGVVFSSGSAVSLPPIITLLKLKFAIILFSFFLIFSVC